MAQKEIELPANDPGHPCSQAQAEEGRWIQVSHTPGKEQANLHFLHCSGDPAAAFQYGLAGVCRVNANLDPHREAAG